MAPRSHQICFSNEFAYGCKKPPLNGGWFMGCCYIKGLETLTREQLRQILKNAPDALGKYVYGTTLENSIKCIEQKLDKLVTHIVAHSTILLMDVYWECPDIEYLKERIKVML